MKTVIIPMPKMAKIIKALGHPVRLKIVLLIKAEGSINVKRIHGKLAVSQPEASKHLSVLRKLSVLTCQRKDGYAYYNMNPDLEFITAIQKQVKAK